MKTTRFGKSMTVPSVVVGCMRLNGLTPAQMNHYLHFAVDHGANFFDHADIYGGGMSETVFGQALQGDASLPRESLIIQSKCGICRGYYDSSREHIVESVENSLRRLQTDYLDVLLLHRPDALVEPEEVAAAFDELEASGKVRHFGVSNHRPMQIALLKKYVRQPLEANQLQLSLPVSNMIAAGMEANMETPGSVDHDGSVLDYCRLHDITIQAWSPFQKPAWKGCFLGSEDYPELNTALAELAEQYSVTPTAIAAAWITRHPAGIQVIAGTTKEERLAEILAGADVRLTRQEWYRLYLAAKHPLP